MVAETPTRRVPSVPDLHGSLLKQLVSDPDVVEMVATEQQKGLPEAS